TQCVGNSLWLGMPRKRAAPLEAGIRAELRPALALAVFTACQPPPDPGPRAVHDPLVYASPLMGAGGFGYAAGSAFVGPCMPHGLAKPAPDTIGKKYGGLRFLHYSGYWAGDET